MLYFLGLDKTMEGRSMEAPKLNSTINISSVITIVVTGATIIWTLSAQLSGYSAQLSQLYDRFEQLEKSRDQAREAANARLAALEASVIKIQNIEYRVTVNEQGVVALNARIDRIGDVIGELREGLAKFNTTIELLNQKIEQAFPGPNR